MDWNECYDFNSSNKVKEELVLVNIRELSRVSIMSYIYKSHYNI